MNEYNFYKEKSFPIVYFISVYAILLISLFVSKIKASENTITFVSYAIPQIIYISVTLIYTKITKVNFFKAIPVNVKLKPIKYIWTILLAVGLFCFSLFPNFIIMYIFDLAKLNPSVSVPVLTGAGNILLAILIICIMPAIGEEIVFRGVLSSSFKEYGGVTAILLSGLLFSLSHFNIAQTVYQFFMGALLCYLYIKSNNLIVPVIIHFLNNLLALFVPTVIPFFRSISMTGITFAVIVPMFFIGLFILVLSIRKLVDDTKKSKVITVFEYSPDQNDFVAIATEQRQPIAKNNIIKRACNEIKQNFIAICSVFNKQKTKEKIDRFKELYPQRKNFNTVIKILIAVIIGLWLISVIL